MTPKPDSRRIDWTLSATPTRRGVRVFLIVGLIPVALACVCLLIASLSYLVAQRQRTPERSFTALDFLRPIASHLDGYDVFDRPNWGDGNDEYDAYAVYDPEYKTIGNVYVFVYYQSYWNKALEAYQDQIQYMTSYKPNSLLTFQSARAQEWTLLCSDRVFASRNMTECDYIARYDEFVVNVSAVVRQDEPSMAEFEKVLRAIDQRAIELLGPMPAPTP
jgi:hypothetical protein